MRLVAYALLVISTIVASLAAATAYAPTVDAAAASSMPLTLAAPAGRDPAQPEKPAVVPGDAQQPTLLTAAVVTRLRAADVHRVRVKEFSVGRWNEAWLFGLGLVGLVTGGLLIRRETQKEIAARTEEGGPGAAVPEQAIARARTEVEALMRDVTAMPDEAQAGEILRRLEAIQATHMAQFVDARPELLGRYGVGGFARLMDSFGAAERGLNRAWSAAADRALAESRSSLERAHESLELTRTRLAELARR